MDPRIRQRRAEVLRLQGRRRLRVLIAAVAVCALIATAVALLHSPVTRVRNVELRGATHTTLGTLLAATGLGKDPLMVDLSPSGVEHQVEALPWVEAATVTKHWPSTVVISVTERRPLAQVDSAGTWALVDGSGRVLARSPSSWPGVPTLEGVGRPSRPGTRLGAAASQALVLIRTLSSFGSIRFTSVMIVPGSGLEAALVPNTIAVFGDSSELTQKIVAVATLASQVDLRTVARMDVRVPSAPALTPG